MPLTQTNRLLRIDTPLGPDVLLLREFTGQEGLSQLFKYELDLLTEGPFIDYGEIIGQAVTVRIELSGEEERLFHGYISRFAQTGSETGLLHYRAEMVPWLWFLTRTADCRIFQNKTVSDIFEQIFQDLGFTDYRLDLEGTYEPLEYCVQYRETDFNFVSRLMEQYGIFYFFEHEETKHTLVLGDATDAHQPLPIQPQVRWEPEGSGILEEDVITGLEFEKVLMSGKFAHTDYNFKTPHTNLTADSPSLIEIGGNQQYEIFDFPGEYWTREEGDTLARIRMETEEAQHFLITGNSTCREFASGYHFNLLNYEPMELNQAYVLTSVSHMASMGNTYSTGGIAPGQESYVNAFRCIPHSVLFRPPRITPKPLVQGAQTAKVVGKPGEEIWTDEFGRIKVQFHWDRYGQHDDEASCFVRLSQIWAGKNWGAQFIPRIGQEVIVEFLEGDPDRPIVTGSLYNAEDMPPYALPGEETKSTIKSNSSKGGEGFNELRFEDKKGEEQIFIHAEKNMDVRVKNDVFETVCKNTHLQVHGDQYNHIGNDCHSTVDNHLIEEVKCDHHLKVTGKEAMQIDGCQSVTVGGDVIQVYKADYSQETTGDTYIKASNIVIEAMTNITLKVGQSYIAIEAGGIKIETMGSLELESTGPLSAKGTAGVKIETPAMAELEGTMTTVKASGVLTHQGALIKIN
jgi:type VI secretion system secreted protein VgrG